MSSDPYKRNLFITVPACILLAVGALYLWKWDNNHQKQKNTNSQKSHPGNGLISQKDETGLENTGVETPEDTIGKKTVYLTFDDGPNFGSDIVMNIAQEENIPVSFFCVGLQFTGEPYRRFFNKTWERMRTQPGVEIYNHGFTHALWNRYDYFYARPDTVKYDFLRAHDSAQYPNKIMRANGNNFWRTSTVHNDTYKRYVRAIDTLTAQGFTIMGWDTEWRHYKFALRQTPEQMAAEVDAMFTGNDNFTPNHCVLLLHEQSLADSLDSAKYHQFIKILKSKPEYRFGRVSGYPGLMKKN